jgi:hypothetical protein
MSHCIAFLSGALYASERALVRAVMPPKCADPVPPTIRSLQNGANASLAAKCSPCPPPHKNAIKSIQTPLIPKGLKSFAIGLAHTNRADFDNLFDLGIPLDPSDNEQERDMLMMYSKETALPTKLQGMGQTKIDRVTAKEATENCDVMHVLYHYRGGNKNLCLAIVPQYESYHLQNFMRVPEIGGGDSKHPLRLVSRGQQWNGERDFESPRWDKQTSITWKKFQSYMENLDGILAELNPIVKRIKVKNVIVVSLPDFLAIKTDMVLITLLVFCCMCRFSGHGMQSRSI